MPPFVNALPPRGAALILALVAALLLFRLGAVPLLGPDEPRYARVAVEMSRSGDLVTPTLQGKPWMEKPILYYWLAAGAFRVLGETETAARLPAVLAALVLVAATGVFGARVYGATAGLYAMLVCGTGLLGFAYGRASTMDMLVAAAVTVGTALLGLRALGISGRLSVPAAWAAIGVGVLAKGPLALVLVGLTLAGFVVFGRQWAQVRRLVTPAGVVAFLLVAAPWYLAVYAAQGQAFLDVFILDHNVKRFTSTVHNHPGPPTFYLPILLGLLFPWSALLPPALVAARPRQSRTDLLVACWLALPFLFFSAAGSKLAGYILPCVPPLALLAGRAVQLRLSGERRAEIAWRMGGLLVVALGALLAASPAWLRGRGDPAWLALVMPGIWALMAGLAYSRRMPRDTVAGLDVLRVAAAGLLLLVTLGAPPLLARSESGRGLFVPAQGREVLAWGAWRTAWMSGYFYNDGRVREISGIADVTAALQTGPALVLAGPAERRRLERSPGVTVLVLAEGARANALLRVTAGAAPVRVVPRSATPGRGSS
jgi:4-amino-4-deoxy-L-arabinose transferase-like glycosyltransferase